MLFYDLFKELIGYIPERLGFLSGFFYETMPYVLMACALFTAFFGLKYLAAWNGVSFFLIGLALSSSALLPKRDLTDLDYWISLAFCLIIAILCAIFSKYLFRVQLVVTTFFAVYATLPSYITYFGETFSEIVSAVVALSVAFLTVKYKYIIMIFVTSFTGAFAFWGVMEDSYGVKHKILFALLTGVVASAFQILINYEQLKETYEEVKKKYKTTKKTSEKAYHEIRDKIHEHEEHKETKKENKPETYEEREDDENEKTD